MAGPKTRLKKRGSTSPRQEALGAGIHAATIELRDGESYRVKLLSGRRATATPAPGVSPKLLNDCLGARRMVMLADGERGPVILGVLQTAPTPHVDPESGAFEVEAKHIRLRADATITLKAGSASLALAESGVARIEGDQVVLNVATLLRALAARVELP